MDLSPHSSHVLIAPVFLATEIGLKEAMIVQQIHYWLSPKRNSNVKHGRNWVYNTYEQWRRQFPFWSERTIQRTILNLEGMGILDTYIAGGYRKVKYYSINYSRLKELGVSSLGGESDVLEEITKSQSGHFDQDMDSNCREQSSQTGTHDHENLAPLYNTKNTTEIPHKPTFDEEEEKNVENMLEIWNELVYQVLYPGKRIRLTSERRDQLQAALRNFFDNKIQKWEFFCQSIAQSGFLMGKNKHNFQVTLDWSLNPQNTIKVLEGVYYSEPTSKVEPSTDKPWDEYFASLKHECEQHTDGEDWFKVCEVLAKRVGQLTFDRCFRLLKLLKDARDHIVLLAPNSFVRDYIMHEYEKELLESIHEVFSKKTKVSIEVGGKDIQF